MYIKGHVKTVNTKDPSNAIVYAMLFVNTVDSGVCSSYTTLYRVMRCANSTLYTVASNTIYVDTVNVRHKYF